MVIAIIYRQLHRRGMLPQVPEQEQEQEGYQYL
jgi:hypothetical protein